MFTPMYRIRWDRPTGSLGLNDTVWGAHTETDPQPIDCWTKDPNMATIYHTRQAAEMERLHRCVFLAINPINPTLSLEEHTEEQKEGVWVPSP